MNINRFCFGRRLRRFLRWRLRRFYSRLLNRSFSYFFSGRFRFLLITVRCIPAVVMNLGLCFLNRIRCRNNRRILPTVGFSSVLVFCPEGSVSFETVAFSGIVISVVAVAEVSVDTETPTEVEAVGDKELLFTFSSAVQAVNVTAINIMLNVIAVFFFILSPSFQATSISKDFEMSRPNYHSVSSICF